MKKITMIRTAILIILLLLGIYISSASLNDGVVSYYKFDSDTTQGNSTIDSLGINNCTIEGNVLVNQTGLVNQSYEFVSTGDGRIDCGNPSSFNFGESNFSIFLFANPDALGTNYVTIGKTDSGFTDNNGWWFQIGTTGNLRFFIDLGIGGQEQRSTETIQADNWSMIGFTINYNKSVKLYINGNETTYSANFTDWKNFSNAQPFQIGAIDDIERNMDGNLDEVYISERTLNNSEVFNLYESWLSGDQYPFQEITPPVINETILFYEDFENGTANFTVETGNFQVNSASKLIGTYSYRVPHPDGNREHLANTTRFGRGGDTRTISFYKRFENDPSDFHSTFIGLSNQTTTGIGSFSTTSCGNSSLGFLFSAEDLDGTIRVRTCTGTATGTDTGFKLNYDTTYFMKLKQNINNAWANFEIYNETMVLLNETNRTGISSVSDDRLVIFVIDDFGSGFDSFIDNINVTGTGNINFNYSIPVSNNPPNGFTLVNPNVSAFHIGESNTKNYLFNWTDSIDPDNDEINYTIKITRDISGDSETRTYSLINISELGINISWLNVSSNITLFTHIWNVTASDGEFNVSSNTIDFHISPSYNLLTPNNQNFTTGDNITFNWTDQIKLFGGALTINYTLHIFQIGVEVQTHSNLIDTSTYTINSSTLALSEYTWNVTGLYDFGGTPYGVSDSRQESYNFNVNAVIIPNNPPSKPILINPENNTQILINESTIFFNWTKSIDIDNETINYTFVIEGIIINTTQNNSIIINNLPLGSYEWYVNVTDGEDINKSNTYIFKIISLSNKCTQFDICIDGNRECLLTNNATINNDPSLLNNFNGRCTSINIGNPFILILLFSISLAFIYIGIIIKSEGLSTIGGVIGVISSYTIFYLYPLISAILITIFLFITLYFVMSVIEKI